MQYLFRPSCFSKVYDLNPMKPEEYAKIFKQHNMCMPNISKPIYHLSVRLEPHIKPTDQEFHNLGIALLDKMGLGTNRPFIIVKHANEKGVPGEHIHVVTSRIDYDKKVWPGRHDAKLAIAVSRELGHPMNFKNSLPGTKPRDWLNDKICIQPKRSNLESQRMQRTGEWADKEHIATSVGLALSAMPCKGQDPLSQDFIDECGRYGVEVKKVIRANGREGLLYGFKGNFFPANKIGRDFTLTGLKRHLRPRFDPLTKEPINAKPSIGDLPSARRKALREHMGREIERAPSKRREEPQEIEDKNIYQMVKDLKSCEFDDLRLVGESVGMQLDFKLVTKDSMGYLQVYVKLIHMEMLYKRQILERSKKKYFPDLITIKKPKEQFTVSTGEIDDKNYGVAPKYRMPKAPVNYDKMVNNFGSLKYDDLLLVRGGLIHDTDWRNNVKKPYEAAVKQHRVDLIDHEIKVNEEAKKVFGKKIKPPKPPEDPGEWKAPKKYKEIFDMPSYPGKSATEMREDRFKAMHTEIVKKRLEHGREVMEEKPSLPPSLPVPMVPTPEPAKVKPRPRIDRDEQPMGIPSPGALSGTAPASPISTPAPTKTPATVDAQESPITPTDMPSNAPKPVIGSPVIMTGKLTKDGIKIARRKTPRIDRERGIDR